MRHAEIVPSNGSSYIIVDGVQWSRHDSVEIAEKVREQIITDFVDSQVRPRAPLQAEKVPPSSV